MGPAEVFVVGVLLALVIIGLLAVIAKRSGSR